MRKVQKGEQCPEYVIQSFVGEGSFLEDDPVKEALKDADVKVQSYLDSLAEDNIDIPLIYKVFSTSTQILRAGDYLTYIITMVFECFGVEEDTEEEE